MNIELAPPSSNAMTHDDALLYCRFLEYDGYRDWRMPTKEEWDSNNLIIGWWVLNRKQNPDFKSCVTPVRDI